MSQVAPIIKIVGEIGGALAAGKMILDTVIDPQQALVDNIEEQRERAIADDAEAVFQRGLQGYLKQLAAVSPSYVARHRPRLEKGYREYDESRGDPDVL